MKSFKNFLVEKNNPNNPSEENPQISKSDAKKLRKMKDADPDTAKRIQAGLESSREAAKRIKSGETRTSQTGQKTRTRPSARFDPSDAAAARQSGRVRTGGDPLKPDTREKPKADTAKITPEKAAERDRFMSSRRTRSPVGQGERRRADAMNQAKADGADKPFKTPRSRGSELLDRLTGRTTRKRSSAIPPDAFGKPSGTDPKTGKAMYVPPKDIPQRKQRVDPKTGKATSAGVKNFAMSQGGYPRSGRNMPKAEFDKIKARADKISSDPTSPEYKKIEKKINQEYGGRRARRRPSNAPSFAKVKAQIDAKNPVRQTPVGPVPEIQQQPQQQPQQRQPKKSFSSFRSDINLGTVDSPVKSMPEKGSPLEVSKGGGASTGGASTGGSKPNRSKRFSKATPTPPKETTYRGLGGGKKIEVAGSPKPAPFKNPIAGFVKGALKRGRSVKPGSPLSMAGQLAAGEVVTQIGKKLEAPMNRAVTRGIASLTGKTDKMKKLKPSAYDMAGPDLTPEIVKRLKPKPVPLPTTAPPETKPSTETEGEYTINRRGRKVMVKPNITSADPKNKPDPKPKTETKPALAPAPPKTEVGVKNPPPPKPQKPTPKPPPIPKKEGRYTITTTTYSPWRPISPK